ncbi:toxin-antitoxin system YwqK family antitoxin [Winogradskyella arenosi]|uniref:MORN repeat protein n=1 Tax=Winogradskyella arenosi TaxID=533325 RepID=A0A368ZDV9_9FLAO|nr:hypothetical protein [Winogradskyella arenosi]RCW91429.1 MORN repeat protein [Winogradskyella arenosi]
MRLLILALSVLLSYYSCQERASNSVAQNAPKAKDFELLISDTLVKKSDLVLNPLNGVWSYNDKPYNGYAVKENAQGQHIEKLGFYQGKRQGVAKTWSDNGVLRSKAYYHQNKLEGLYTSYWENGLVALEVTYKAGKKEGQEKQFYSNGELSKLRWLEGGKEKGLQKAWLPNGKLYVNYEVKNDRVFGLMRANACYKLENEKVVKKK